LEVRLIYYPPYHSKYNPVERCWSALERKWNGVLLSCLSIVLACARRMTWKGNHPEIAQLPGLGSLRCRRFTLRRQPAPQDT